MLQGQTIDAADHDDGIEDHERGSHGRAKAKTRMQDHQRNRQEREPDMSPHPTLDGTNWPKNDSLPQTQQDTEDKDGKGNSAKGETYWRATHTVMLGRRLS